MTIDKLLIELKTSGFPVAYNAFENEVKPPYITFIRPTSDNVSSDESVHGKFQNYNIELYTKKKDLEAEKKIEAILNKIDPDYDTIEVYIDTERLLQVTYSITIFEKVGN